MEYQNYADYNDIPPMYGRLQEAYYDRGNGVPLMDENNMTIQDIYRTPFLFLQDHQTKDYWNMAPLALKGIQSESELSKLFFSDENMKRIQKMIRKEVFRKTNGEFRVDVDQDSKDLFFAMRGTYMEQARSLPNQTVRQIKRLNWKVVDDAIYGILTSLRQDYGYLKEINKPLSPIPLPLNVNNAGRRTLPALSSPLGF
jgi:hypothetical protein